MTTYNHEISLASCTNLHEFPTELTMWISLEALLFMSAVGSFLVHTTIPKLRQMFIKV